MKPEDLKLAYNRQQWQAWLGDIFGSQAQFETHAESVDFDRDNIKSIQRFGFVELADKKNLAVLDIETRASIQIARNRVGLRNLVAKYINRDNYHGILAFYHSESVAQDEYRLSFICSEPMIDVDGKISIQSTAPKRFTYVLGEHEKTKTPSERLKKIAEKKEPVTLDDVKDAFSVEALSKEFFDKYKEYYQQLVEFFTGERVVKKEGKWQTVKIKKPDNQLISFFNGDKKASRDFCKKLLGRIVFICFLQKKGWLGASDETYKDGDKNFIQNYFKATKTKGTFYLNLCKLFFDTLNNSHRKHDNFEMPDGKIVKIPFLNGGLFEQDYENEWSLVVPEDILKEFLGFLDQYNFTIYESDPNDHTVAVDPEMLGRIFENLLEDNKEKGAYYTPKEIVHYMCQESLIEYLTTWFINKGYDVVTHTALDSTQFEPIFTNESREQFVLTEDTEIKRIDKSIIECLLKRQLDDNSATKIKQHIKEFHTALDTVKICDPAIGSGAFPMGLLLEIFSVKEMLHFFEKGSLKGFCASEVKLKIIQNSIYGVDIEMGAVDIARLRFWLSLIIDEKLPRPLPNLDYKIVMGDSLVSRFENNLVDIDWEEKENYVGEDEKGVTYVKNVHANLKELIKNQKLFFSTNELAEKDVLKEKIRLLKIEVLINQISYNKINYQRDNLKSNVFLGKTQKNKVRDLEIDMKIANFNNSIQKLQQLKLDSKQPLQFFDWKLDFLEIMNPSLMRKNESVGFDIVIGNPPYVSTKGVCEKDKELFEKEYGFSDDTYTHFFFKGCKLLTNDGSLTYITPKTFWTTQTKRNLRELLLSKTIKYIFDVANPFNASMVDTCIISIQNNNLQNNKMKFLDGSKDLSKISMYAIGQSIYLNAPNLVIFKPTLANLKIYELYGEKVKELYNKWWDKISNSENIEKNRTELEAYRKSLKPGDVALLGCLTEGGQGLATANNGKYIAVRKSTKWAKKILKSRPKKLAEAIKTYKIRIVEMAKFSDTTEYIESLNERQIAELFDNLKEKYGRDIFGRGYIYRLIDDNEIADIDTLTEKEKHYGISENKKHYVLYDKGDKDGNRWYLETPFAIAWTQKNVGFLRADPKARYQGYTFYFKEGFCWSNVLTTHIKCRKKQKTIHSTESMSFFSVTESIPEYYMICMINSRFIAYYVDSFVNATSHCTTGDAKLIPILVPTSEQLKSFKLIFDNALLIRKKESREIISEKEAEALLEEVQKELDNAVAILYGL